MDADSHLSDIEDTANQWRPRDFLRRTNWLYRVDALRLRDIREMRTFTELFYLCQHHAQQFIVWAWALRYFSTNPLSEEYSARY